MRALPTGTVTLLFTDIEGSTRLLETLGPADYADVLAEHRRVLRASFDEHGGVEVDTQGDAFFVVFPRASQAVAAATAAQARLAAGPIRIRIGLHTGEPLLAGEGYVGTAVHEGARIAAAGHGGQVLLSETTWRLGDFDGLDLGEHRLKDIPGRRRLYQLGRDRFPPLKTLNQRHLPAPSGPLFGRERELADVLSLVGEEHVRLVTITGAGGIGKTRLALDVATELVDRYDDGTWFVDLSPLRSADLVVSMIADALTADGDPALSIGDRELLLVLDNFEHVVGAAPEISELLAACPRLTLVATSREPLLVRGEREYLLQPLTELPAVELFRHRAVAVDARFAADDAVVAELCRRLDGLPLAIELAAVQTRALSVREMLDRLEPRLPLLGGARRDAPERQQTLRATIDWSYELLTPPQRRLCRRLGIFAGGFEVAAAEAVCDAELADLQALVAKSLVCREETGRLGVLETLREYARERLEQSGELGELATRHARYFLELAEQARSELATIRKTGWIERLERERDNIRAALAWFAGAGDARPLLRLTLALWRFWYRRGHLAEGRQWLERGLAAADPDELELRAQALLELGHIAFRQGDVAAARDWLERTMPLLLDLGDDAGYARALYYLAGVASTAGELEAATRLGEQAVAAFDLASDGHGAAMAMHDVALVAIQLGDYARARSLLEEALAFGREHDDSGVSAAALVDLGFLDLYRRRYAEAAASLRAGMALYEDLEATLDLAWCAEGAAAVALEQGDAPAAVRLASGVEQLTLRRGARRDPHVQHMHERTLAAARERLEPEAFAAAAAEGAEASAGRLFEWARRAIDAAARSRATPHPA